MYKTSKNKFYPSKQNTKDLIGLVRKNNIEPTAIKIRDLSLVEFFALNNALANNMYVTKIECPAINDYNYFGREHHGTAKIIAQEINKSISRNRSYAGEKIDLCDFLKE